MTRITWLYRISWVVVAVLMLVDLVMVSGGGGELVMAMGIMSW
jgi:hypothetical protein